MAGANISLMAVIRHHRAGYRAGPDLLAADVMGRNRQRTRAGLPATDRLPLPLAALTIVALSGGLWFGIIRLAMALL